MTTGPHAMFIAALWMGGYIGYVVGVLVTCGIFSAARSISGRWRRQFHRAGAQSDA